MYQVNSQKLTEIAHRCDLDLVIVFGSQVQGQARPESDIDVAVRWIRRDWEDVERERNLNLTWKAPWKSIWRSPVSAGS